MKKILLLLGFVTLFSCSNGGDNSETGGGDDYDRTKLLNAVIENNVLPAFSDLDTKLATLDLDITSFLANPNTTTLASVQASYLEAYKVWQHVQMFNVLLATQTGYKGDMNTYPADATEIASFIDGSFGQAISEISFTATSKNDAQGFPAIDYLINNGDDSDVVAHFSTDTNTANYKELLKLYIDRMITLTDAIIVDWNTNKATFIADNSNSLTSSFNLFINDYIFYIEKEFREAKIAFPSGVRENIVANVTRVESFYSPSNSKALFQEAYTAVQNVFTGTPYSTENTTPIGINDYLDFVSAEVFIDNENIELSRYIEDTLFTNINTEVAKLNADFVIQIEVDNAQMHTTFTVLQEMVVALKVNALGSLSVDVDYVDSDGD